jgi:hypothetical protein
MTGSAQLVLGQSQARSLLKLKNIGINAMWLEFGGARATATLTSGVVTGISLTNVGFNYTKPPLVRFLGGGYAGNSSFLGLGQPNAAAPNSMNGLTGRPAVVVAALTGGAVSSSFTIEDGGAGYATAPYVQLINSDLDPNGCAVPSAGVGWLLSPGEALSFEATACTTDAISVIGTSGDVLTCRYMD